jgi:hypothetical protein
MLALLSSLQINKDKSPSISEPAGVSSEATTASIITDIAEGGPSQRHREYKEPYLPLAFTPLLSNFARRLYFARSQIIWFVAPVGVRITRSPAPNTYARTTSSPTCPGLTLALRW